MNKPFLTKPDKQINQIIFGLPRRDIKFPADGRYDRIERVMSRGQIPDDRPNRVQPVIPARAEVKEDAFSIQRAVDVFALLGK